MAVTPFVISHVVLVVATLAGAAALLFAAIRLRRRLPPFEVRLWATAPRCVLALGLSCVPLLAALELVTVKRTNRESGWSLVHAQQVLRALPGFIFEPGRGEPDPRDVSRLRAALKGSRPFAFTEGARSKSYARRWAEGAGRTFPASTRPLHRTSTSASRTSSSFKSRGRERRVRARRGRAASYKSEAARGRALSRTRSRASATSGPSRRPPASARLLRR